MTTPDPKPLTEVFAAEPEDAEGAAVIAAVIAHLQSGARRAR